MTTTPPGWYDDGHGALRWWDGTQWTEHVHVPEAAPAHPVTPPLPTQSADQAATAAAAAAPVSQPGVDPSGDAAAQLFAGAPPAEPPPTKSRLWIVFAIVGGVILLLIVLAAVFVPMAVRTIADAVPRGVAAQDADESAALESVELYDQAWREADCEKFQQATTEEFRAGLGLADCALFAEQASLFGQATSEYDIRVTDIVREADAIVVATDESYLSSYDELGEPVDEPVLYTDHYRYTLVAQDEAWLIDDTQVS